MQSSFVRWQRSSRLLLCSVLCGLVCTTLAGCGGTYASRMEKNAADLKAGRRQPGGGAVASGVSPLLYAGVYEIVNTQSQPTGIKINLPKSFLDPSGTPLFTINANVGDLVEAVQGETTLMVWYYPDPNGKRMPAILSYSRVPAQPNDPAKADALLTAGFDAPPSITEFTSPAGKWRKTSVDIEMNLPSESISGAQVSVPARNDRYVLMTSNENILIQAIAPTTVADNFFSAVEAAVRTVQVGPPAVTGQVVQ